MRFYKVKIVVIATLLIAGFLGTPAKADNANPPKIIDLNQLTKGPYRPGDLVTFKIIYTGGNPGLDNEYSHESIPKPVHRSYICCLVKSGLNL